MVLCTNFAAHQLVFRSFLICDCALYFGGTKGAFGAALFSVCAVALFFVGALALYFVVALSRSILG